MKYNLIYILIILQSINHLICSCSSPRYLQLPEYQQTLQEQPNYNELNYWAAHPWKKDPSDSISKAIAAVPKDSVADVFFVHPTSFTNMSDTSWNATLNNPILNATTDYSSILYQATVFNEQSRIFAPRYHQANLKVYFTTDSARTQLALQFAYEDVRNAFIAYLAKWNNGRPIIIAAHSQGTQHAAQLLKEFFDGKPLEKKLITAYLIGMPVSTNYFKSLKSCQSAGATGCIISWRTFQRGYTDPLFVAHETFKAIVVNPLNWSTTEAAIVSRKLNQGAVLKNFNRIHKAVVDAEVHQNVLWTCKPKFFGNFLIRQKNYHVGDINLFYMNIRSNLHQQIQSYLINHTSY